MSAILVLPVVFPIAGAAWPVVVGAVATAASALGYAAAGTKNEAEDVVEVELPVENADAVATQLAAGEEVVFSKDDVQVVFYRDERGQVGLRVYGAGKSEEELRAMGQELANAMIQQYAYHRLKTELKSRDLNIVEEQVDEDGTVRLHVRTYNA